MTVSMYQLSVPVFIQFLAALSDVLDKAEDYCKAKKVEESFLLNMRLYPDMYPLVLQVQQSCSHAERICSTLARITPLNLPKTETTFCALHTRITKTIDFLKALTPEELDGTEDSVISHNDRVFSGRILLLHRTLPHFYFHCSTAYGILRHCGVPLVKHDFLGTPLELLGRSEDLQNWHSSR